MRRFPIAPTVKHPFFLWIFENWNRFMLWWAKRYAKRKAIDLNKAMYGSQMFGSILVYSSKEKADINSGVPKGNHMNHAKVLAWSLFIITPQQARKKRKKQSNGKRTATKL